MAKRKRHSSYDWPDTSLQLWTNEELLRSLDDFREAVANGNFYPPSKADETLMRIETELIARGINLPD